MMIASVFALALLGQNPKLVDAFNMTHVDRKLVERSGKWRLAGTRCDKKTVSRFILDEANGYLSFVGRHDSACDEDSEVQFAAFTRADSSFVWLESVTNLYGSQIESYSIMDDKMTIAPPEIEASLPKLDALLPKTAGKSSFTPKVQYVLPQRGTSVVAQLCAGDADKWCAGLDPKTPQPPECAPDAKGPLREGLKAKWNMKQSRFDPVAP